ncbi:hypothetical protein KEJ45_07035 [Candidatus Bathyarchaeota archaeon]|nr:hypothetical protein [Candidatus Bathyarchaeota archaeon]
MQIRISVRIEDEQLQQIQAKIKNEYPKMRTVSDVVRAALKEFLSRN